MPQHFYIVDVFAEQPYAGNQLAVVIGDELPNSETMQRIAAETNYSETTFVSPELNANGSYAVRIFTPAREIDFAGHPVLGTAWVLKHYVMTNTAIEVPLELSIGAVTVTFEVSESGDEIAWFRAPSMSLGKSVDPEFMAAALGLATQDIDDTTPIQQVSAGTSAMIVPVRDFAALQRARLDLEAYAPLAAQGFPPLTYLFCSETQDPESDFCVRFFFEAHGVREDPATGNGAAFFGAYLLEHKTGSGGQFSLRIEQGHAVQRPSRILLKGQKEVNAETVYVGGQVIPVIEGRLL